MTCVIGYIWQCATLIVLWQGTSNLHK